MEGIVILLIGGLVFLLVGAAKGMIAAARTKELRCELDELKRVLHDLRRERRTGDATGREPTASPSAPGAADASPTEPLPTPEAPPPSTAPVSPAFPSSPPPPPLPPPQTAPSPTPIAEAVPAQPPPLPFAGQREAEPPASVAPTMPTSPSEPAGRPIPQPPAFAGVEQALGMRWLVWIGLAMLFLGVAFFLKYAYDRDWLGRFFGPRLRITTAFAAAATLLFLGWRNQRNGLAAFGQGLLGGGQAMLYLTIFAAFQPAAMVVDAPLFGPTTAFLLMAVVTAGGLAAAVRLDAIAMAFLAVLGGFATPVLIQTGQDARDLLCLYLLVLDLGVLAVASYRQWRALDLLAFAGTVALFGGWWNAFGGNHPQPDATLAWVGVFHAVFAVLPFVQHWRRRTPVTIERFALALANLACTLAFLVHTLHAPAPRLLAVLCVCGAGLYAGLGLVTARRVGDDRRTRDGFLALAAMQLTLALFFLLPGGGVGAAWYAEATVLLWLGYRFAHAPSRTWAVVVFGAAVVRTLLHDVPGTDLLADHPSGVVDPGLALLWNAWFVDLLLPSLAAGAFGFLHRRLGTTPAESRLAATFGIASGLWFVGATGIEIGMDAVRHPDAWRTLRPAVAIAWLHTAGALGFLLWARQWPRRATFLASFVPLFVAGAATCIAYTGYPADAWPVWNGAFAAGFAALAVLALAGRLAPNCGEPASSGPNLLGFAQLALFALATVEAASYVQRGTEAPPRGTLTQVLGWVWLGLGGGGALLGILRQNRRVLAIACLPLVLAAIVPILLLGVRLDPHALIANQRFLFGMLVAGVFAALRTPLQRMVATGLANAAAAAGFALMMVYGAAEGITWSTDTQSGRLAVAWGTWMAGLTAVLGTTGGLLRARATGNPALRTLALLTLTPALLLPLFVYGTAFEATAMFANLRFVLVAGAVAAGVLWTRRDGHRPAVGWSTLATALLGLTLEPPIWLLDHIDDAAEAARLANFSITVTWVLAAVAMLTWGFRRDRRPLRLVALGLFVLTGAKVLVLDMSGAQQLYRILAFVLVGITFVGASWLYHRAEKRLAASRPDRPEAAQDEQRL